MSEPTTPPIDHTVKVTHLVFGLLFVGIAGVWALVTGAVITADRLTYLGPGVLIAAGVVGLVASVASTRNSRRTRDRSTFEDNTEEIR
ncbi:MAG: hypothetical protein ABIN79_02300 [Marmoricola sp.]